MTRRAVQAPVSVQLECGEEDPLYVSLGRAELRAYADVYRRCLTLLGLRSGDTLALYDYGTSPAVYLASGAYMPYLGWGAAERLGCATVCNDGLPNLARRAVDLLRLARPRFLVVRADCLQPLLHACELEGLDAIRCLEAVVVTYNEGPRPLDLGRYSASFGVPLLRLPRSDAALFMALECPECRLAHTWADRYRVDILAPEGDATAAPWLSTLSHFEKLRAKRVDVKVAVTARFGRAPARRTLEMLQGRVVSGECPRGPGDIRLVL